MTRKNKKTDKSPTFKRKISDVFWKVGDRVKMSGDLKSSLTFGGSDDHVEEFGECTGVIDSDVEGRGTVSPVIDVRWEPSGLRFGYDPRLLERA